MKQEKAAAAGIAGEAGPTSGTAGAGGSGAIIAAVASGVAGAATADAPAAVGAGADGGVGAIDWRMRPRRAAGAELSAVTDGFLVYQPERDRVHYLNPTAALLLEICDGSLAAGDLPPLIAAAFSLGAAPRDEVAACLSKLLAEGLLADDAEPCDSLGGDSESPDAQLSGPLPNEEDRHGT
jgi:hypothetical protein